MVRGKTQTAWRTLDTLLTTGTLGSFSDGQLLDHFRCSRDATGQDAFRILVERHGAMVLGVCRALVKDPHEAEDAFQATFLVLVRRCESIRNRETIAPWLYGVACRVARRAQIRSSRRRKREIAAEVDPPARDGSGLETSGTDQILQDEIRRLPESLRAPLILCCLEGQSYDLAARRLGLRESTLRGRLHRARQRLERQLRRRGILSPVVARLLEPSGLALPPLSSSLIESTTQFAVRWSSLSGLLVGATAVPESIAALAQGVIHTMLLQTAKVFGVAAILTVGTVGAVVVAQQKPGANGPAIEAAAAGQPSPKGAGVPPSSRAQVPGINNGRQTQRILQALQEKYELDLPPEPTPTSPGPYPTLNQLLKAIKKATTRPEFPGIPIYVDPVGLQEASVSLDSPVTIYRNGTLGFVLRQALRDLHLWYVVKDGLLMISSRADITDQRLDELDQKVDRLLKAIERSELPQKEDPAERRK
jgi:RNA polymerase sigma factor (sigma-70 family)